MTRDETLKEIERVGVVAVIRTDSAVTSVEVCRSLVEGGVTACEITMTVPGAIDAIRTTTATTTTTAATPAGCYSVVHAYSPDCDEAAV